MFNFIFVSWLQNFWEQEPHKLFLFLYYLNILIFDLLMVCVFKNAVLQVSFTILFDASPS